MSRFRGVASIALLSLVSTVGQAKIFEIRNRTFSTTAQAIPAAVTALNSAADQVENQVNDTYLTQDKRQRFSNGLGKAGTSANTALINDHANPNGNTFTFGLGLQVSAFTDGKSISDFSDINQNELPEVGATGNMGLMVGMPADTFGFIPEGFFLDPKKLMLYGNLFYFSSKFSEVKASMFSLGVNARYELFEGIGHPALASWGGLYVGTGLNFATNTFTYAASLKPDNQSVSSGGETASITTTMNYELGAKSTNFLIPMEVSSSVRFLYAFTLYAGGSVDINLGSARLTGDGTGTLNASTTSVATDAMTATPTLDLNDGTSGGTSFLGVRGFAGLQLHLYVLKLGVEYSALTNGASSAAFLMKVVI